MARFHLHVHNRIGFVPDEEGQELHDVQAAREVAIASIRSIVAEEAQEGVIDLTGRVEIAEHGDGVVAVVPFREAFLVEAVDRG